MPFASKVIVQVSPPSLATRSSLTAQVPVTPVGNAVGVSPKSKSVAQFLDALLQVL